MGHFRRMSEDSTARRFMSALDELDSSSDAGSITSLFAENPELLRPEVDKAGSSNQDPDHAGVSLLSLDDDGKVKRFSTYYDTAAFLEPADSGG